MRTDLKVGVICLFALVLACVGFFAYHSNKAGDGAAAAPSHSADNHAMSVASPADAPTTAPSAAIALPAPGPSLGFGPSHALGADTPYISPPSPTTAPSSTALIPPTGSTGMSAPGGTGSSGGLSSPGGMSSQGGMSPPSSLQQPLVPSSGSSGLGGPGSTGLSTGSPSLLPPSTGPSSVSGGMGNMSGTSGTSGFGTSSTGTMGESPRTSTLEIGPAPSHTTHGSSVDLSGFGTSSSSSLSTGSGGEYAIQKGDTIGALAKKNHTTTKAVLAANPGVNPNRLKVGQKIKIPEASSSTGSSSLGSLGGSSLSGSSSSSFDTTFGTGSTTTKPATKGHKGATGASTRTASKSGKATGSQSSLAGGTYTIKKGDTLRKIAKSVYGDERLWRRIFRENRGDLASPNALKVGETIRLPK